MNTTSRIAVSERISIEPDCLVVTALPWELLPIVAPWGIRRPEKGVVYCGETETGVTIAAAFTGPGTINAAVGLSRLLQTVDPDVILAGGIGGGTGAQYDGHTIMPGDVVIASSVGFYDTDVTALGLPLGTLERTGAPDLPAPLSPDPNSVARALSGGVPIGRVVCGPILSGDCFLDSRLRGELPETWRVRIAGALVVDMESAAWAAVAAELRRSWVVLRYVSDDTSTDTRISFREACENAGRVVAQFVDFFFPLCPDAATINREKE